MLHCKLYKQLILLGALSLSSSSFANGFYLGTDLGYDTANFQEQIHFLNKYTEATTTSNLAAQGALAEFFGGYDWNFQPLYLGTELSQTFSKLAYQTNYNDPLYGTGSATRFTINKHTGLSVLPGYLFKDSWLIYGRLGYERGDFRSVNSDSSLVSLNKWLDGIGLGFGISKKMTSHWHARLDFSHIQYQAVYMEVSAGSTATTTQIKPRTNQVSLGLAYQFN